MANNVELLNVLAVAFAPASGYTPAAGDIVKVSGVWEVNKCATGDIFLGRVNNVDIYQPTRTVNVNTRFSGCVPLIASAAVTAGALIVPGGSNKVRAFNAETDGPEDIMGIAIETAAADGDTIYSLVK